MVVVVIVALAMVFSISYHPVRHLAISSIFIVLAAAAAAVMTVLVVVAVVVISLGMYFCLKVVQFSCLLKRRNGQTDGPTVGQTDGWTYE